MTLVKLELRQGKTALIIWTVSIAFLLILCILIFPDMENEMDTVGKMFASMGSFTAAFGMDRLNIGTLTGFYSIECGNILGLGGALFASQAGISILAKEERDRTAEFLLTHPITRTRVVTAKLAALLIQITVMNLVILASSLLSIRLIGEPVPWRELFLMHGAYYLLQLELGSVCFGISAFLHRGGTGIGMGFAASMYFLNLIANMTENMKFLKYITPFGYCDGADLIAAGGLNARLAALGGLLACIGIGAAYGRYREKDIANG